MIKKGVLLQHLTLHQVLNLCSTHTHIHAHFNAHTYYNTLPCYYLFYDPLPHILSSSSYIGVRHEVKTPENLEENGR